MLFDDLDLTELLNIKTVDEAKKYILESAPAQAAIETMAFRQVILNILLVSGLVTENDFNAAIAHYKEESADFFAKKLLDEVNKANKFVDQAMKVKINSMLDDDDDTSDEEEIKVEEDIAKA